MSMSAEAECRSCRVQFGSVPAWLRAAQRGPCVRHNEEVSVAPEVNRTFRADRALAYVSGFGAVGLGLSAMFAATGVGIPCPFRTLTGWDCPLCGGTRMGAALLHGDVAAAYGYNPLVLLALSVVGVLSLLWVVEALGGPAVRLPARWTALARRVTLMRRLVIGLVVAVVYSLLRNLA